MVSYSLFSNEKFRMVKSRSKQFSKKKPDYMLDIIIIIALTTHVYQIWVDVKYANSIVWKCTYTTSWIGNPNLFSWKCIILKLGLLFMLLPPNWLNVMIMTIVVEALQAANFITTIMSFATWTTSNKVLCIYDVVIIFFWCMCVQ